METQQGAPSTYNQFRFYLDSYQNTSRFSHDAVTRHGANQRYTLLHVVNWGCARETVFFFFLFSFYVQKKRSARVHVKRLALSTAD